MTHFNSSGLISRLTPVSILPPCGLCICTKLPSGFRIIKPLASWSSDRCSNSSSLYCSTSSSKWSGLVRDVYDSFLTIFGLIELRHSIIRSFIGFGVTILFAVARSFVASLYFDSVCVSRSVTCWYSTSLCLSSASDRIDSHARNAVPTSPSIGIAHSAHSFTNSPRFLRFCSVSRNSRHVSPWSKYAGRKAKIEPTKKI